MRKKGYWPDERESTVRVLTFEEEKELDAIEEAVSAVVEMKMTVEEFDSKVSGFDMLRLMRWRPVYRKILLTIEEKRATIKKQVKSTCKRDPWDEKE